MVVAAAIATAPTPITEDATITTLVMVVPLTIRLLMSISTMVATTPITKVTVL